MSTGPLAATSQIALYKPAEGGEGYTVVDNPVTKRKELHFTPQYSYSPSHLQQVILSPTINSTSFGQQTQFQVTPNLASRVHHMVLSFVVQNTSGVSTVTPSFAQYFIQNVQICVNGNTTPIVTLQPEYFLWSLEQYNVDTLAGLAAGNSMNINYPTSFTEGAAIPASGSMTYSFIIDSALVAKLPCNLITANMNINVNWALAPPVESGAGGLALVSSQLTLHTQRDPLTDRIINDYFINQKIPFILTFDNVFQITYQLALTAGQQTLQLLSGVIGYISKVDIALISSTAISGGAYRTYASISGTDVSETSGKLDLLDAQRNSLLGSNNSLSGKLSRYTLPALHSGNKGGGTWLSVTAPFYQIYGTPAPVKDLESTKGSADGGFFLTGTEYLSILPGATFASGTYNVVTIWHKKGQMRLDTNGQFTQEY